MSPNDGTNTPTWSTDGGRGTIDFEKADTADLPLWLLEPGTTAIHLILKVQKSQTGKTGKAGKKKIVTVEDIKPKTHK